MNQIEYNNLLEKANKFLKCGRDFYPSINGSDLMSEIIEFLLNENLEINEINFDLKIKKARAKLVKEYLDANPNERIRHNRKVNRYKISNREQINKKRRANEKFNAKGKNHGKFKGVIVTPFGEFESSYSAGDLIGVSHRCILYRIKNNNFKDYFIKDATC